MNNKITFPRLATLLADHSGRSKRFSEDFLREFFSLISETLEAKESVKIKGLGSFRLTRVEARRSVDVTTGEPMEISGHTKVVFTPAKELAEAINAPFEAFTAIEISDDTDISQLFTKEEMELQKENEDQDRKQYYEEYQPQSVNENEEFSDDINQTAKIEKEDDETSEIITEESPTFISSEVDRVAPEALETIEALEASEENQEDSYEGLHEGTENVDLEHNTDEASESISNEETGTTETETINEDTENTDVSDNTSNETNTEISEGIEDLEEETSPSRNWARGLKISLIAACIALFATLAIWYVFATNDFNGLFHRSNKTAEAGQNTGFIVGKKLTDVNSPDATTAIPKDSIADTLQDKETEEEVPTAPSDIVVYDTISTTRYLTTMAKAHYGNYNLWPYIYEENKSFLGHPDRIRPGTPVVIPKLSKYGVDPSRNEDIEKAKKLGVDIYARYGKKI